MTDKRIIRISSTALFAVLLIALVIPFGESGRIVAAILLLPAAALIYHFIKKRGILSINKNQILMIMTVVALLYLMLYYLSGLKFGFYKNPYRLSLSNFFMFVLPIAAIVFSTEIIRYVMVAQNDKLSGVLCYFSFVIAEMLVRSNIPSVTTFNRFMDLVAGAFFPALISTLLYNYLSKRYGVYPNLVFRLLTTLHTYILPVEPGIAQSLVNLVRLFLPIVIFLFIDTLYEKKRRYALQNTSRFAKVMSKVLTVIVVILMVGTVMLISNQFYYGALVIATESMTGELDKGDIAIYESYEDQIIIEGQVIVFEKDSSTVVHRVADIEIINGVTRYYTKGDANEDMDAGFITDSDVIGLVHLKLPYFGYPTLWMRSLFAQ